MELRSVISVFVVTARMTSMNTRHAEAYLIAQNIKPTDRAFLEQCLVNEETGKSRGRNLESKAALFKFYSLARDESSDATDTALLAIFLRSIDNEYHINALVPLRHN